MSTVWTKDRLLAAGLAPREGKYEVIPATPHEEFMKTLHPHLFSFNAVSIGDDSGQLCVVPLDESSKESAQFIVEAIKFYVKHIEETK